MAYFHLGNAAYARGLQSRAIAAWQRATDIDSSHRKGWHNLANALVESERLVEAATALSRLTELEPQQASYWYILGQCRLKLGDRDAASVALKHYIALDGNRTDNLCTAKKGSHHV
jgi:predicted Zn-dependent protease